MELIQFHWIKKIDNPNYIMIKYFEIIYHQIFNQNISNAFKNTALILLDNLLRLN